METSEKIKQCEKDIKILEQEKERLIKELKQQSEKDVPVFHTVNNQDVLIIKLNGKMRDSLNAVVRHEKMPYIAIDSDGCWCWGFFEGDTIESVKKHFDNNIIPLFKE